MQYVAFSGGKDSTATALRMAELGEEFECVFTPTGDELPDVFVHIDNIMKMLGKKIITPPNHSLDTWIREFNALPNWRQRWCTRVIKIQPCIAFLKANPGSTLVVGLRADEQERKGLYGDYAKYRYPLREWGWGIKEVLGYLFDKGVKVPKRTDCAVCPYQRLGEWWLLWKNYPERYKQGEKYEEMTGYTFRSPGRDTWPAALKDLRKEFESGRTPRGLKKLLSDDDPAACRVCSL